jgi:hypothetical protein
MPSRSHGKQIQWLDESVDIVGLAIAASVCWQFGRGASRSMVEQGAVNFTLP